MTGKVISTKMTKALTVSVKGSKYNSLLKKRYNYSRKYKAACVDSSKYAVGDVVTIESCRPVSKTIRFKVIEK